MDECNAATVSKAVNEPSLLVETPLVLSPSRKRTFAGVELPTNAVAKKKERDPAASSDLWDVVLANEYCKWQGCTFVRAADKKALKKHYHCKVCASYSTFRTDAVRKHEGPCRKEQAAHGERNPNLLMY